MSSTDSTQIVRTSNENFTKRKKKVRGFAAHEPNDPARIKTYSSLKAALLANV
jgi:hypothetical protein